MAKQSQWPIFQPTDFNDGRYKQPERRIYTPPEPPPWRRLTDMARKPEYSARAIELDDQSRQRGEKYIIRPEEARLVNAALFLRRPLLVTGRPGIGKSSLASAIAYQLQLGPVLHWPISTRTTLRDGLYSYDAIARLQETNFQGGARPPIGDFIRLGPLGTALHDGSRGWVRVVLIDEIDKGDIDLPNDLLNVLEEGRFRVEELFREDRQARQDANKDRLATAVDRFDRDLFREESSATIAQDGIVACSGYYFPIIIMTSNGERDFPPAFLRRCIRLDLSLPDSREDYLRTVIAAYFTHHDAQKEQQLHSDIKGFLKDFDPNTPEHYQIDEIALDQLLNAFFMIAKVDSPEEQKELKDALLRPLTGR